MYNIIIADRMIFPFFDYIFLHRHIVSLQTQFLQKQIKIHANQKKARQAMLHKILIVEDDADINNLLKRILTDNGYDIGQSFSGTEAIFSLEKEIPDCILLDLMLPGMTGEELLQKIRSEQNLDIPVLVLSAKTALKDKVSLLQTGADDYITKPFEPDEVIARVQAALRRSAKSGSDALPELLSYKNMKLYPELRKVTLCEEELSLTKMEYDILHLLIQNPEKVFSRESLYEQVWGDGYYGTDHTVDVHINNLRRKIKNADSKKGYIQTVYGIGFRLAKS